MFTRLSFPKSVVSYVEDRLSSISYGRATILIAFLGAMWIFILGVKSDIHLGDEPTHYVLASTIYDTKSRPLYYSEIHNSPVTKKWAGSEVLWHGLLACLWWLWGGKSKVLAQLYQAGWYTLLVVVTYLLASTLYTERRGLYSAILVATIPMVASYSIMFYQDVPLMALTTLCFLLLVRRQYFWAGVVLGLMCLMKRNAYLLVPFLIITIIYQLKDVSSLRDLKNLYKLSTLGEGYKKLAAFVLPAVFINLPDLYFRSVKFHGALFYSKAQAAAPNILEYSVLSAPFNHPENFIIYPENLIKYPGIALYVCLVLYLLRRQYNIKDFPAVLSCLGYIIVFPIAAFLLYLKDQSLDVAIANINNILNTNLSFRYIAPIFPLIAILASGGFVSLENKSLRKALIGLCILQVFVSTLHVYNARLLTPSTKKAYEFVRIYTPINSNILTTDTDIVIHAGRKVMWSSDGTMPHLSYLFWGGAKSNEVFEILKTYGITHLYISKDNIWDDSKVKNIGKYPRSFVNRLPSLSFVKCIFDNESATVWTVEPTYVSIDKRNDSVAQ